MTVVALDRRGTPSHKKRLRSRASRRCRRRSRRRSSSPRSSFGNGRKASISGRVYEERERRPVGGKVRVSWQQKRGKKWKTIHSGLEAGQQAVHLPSEAQALRERGACRSSTSTSRSYKASTAILQEPARQALIARFRAVSNPPSLVVVGAGTFGASLAWRLRARRLGRHARRPGRARARARRLGRRVAPDPLRHGADAWHTALGAARAGAVARARARACVVLLAASPGSPTARTAGRPRPSATMRAQGIPCERLDPDAARGCSRASPATTSRSCSTSPRRACCARSARCRRWPRRRVAHGARLVRGRARPDGDARCVLDDGGRLEADGVVWACGAWLAGAVPRPASTLRVTQPGAVLLRRRRRRWRAPASRAGSTTTARSTAPATSTGSASRSRPDVEGPPLRPRRRSRAAGAEHERWRASYLARRFPALADAPLIGARACRYELTPDSHFIAAPHPEHDARVAARRRLGPRLQARPGDGRAVRGRG